MTDPRSPGGFASVQPMRMSGGPPVNPFAPDIRAFPRFPGDSMGARPLLPGQRASAPAGALSMRPTPSKGGMPSQEYVVGTVVASPWPRQNYHKTQAPGAWLFHQRPMQPGEMGMLTVAQVNNMLRDWQNIMLSQNTRKPQSTVRINGGIFEPETSQYRKYVEEYLIEGESRMLRQDIKDKIFGEDEFRKLAVFSLQHLVTNYRSAGPYATRDRADVPSNALVMNVGWRGPTDYQPVTNYWGDVQQGQHCWFILRRVNNGVSTNSTSPKDQVFQYVPWFSDSNREPDTCDLTYTDVAGKTHTGLAISCGMVMFTPLQHSNDHERLCMAGLTANHQDAYNTESRTSKRVVLNVGVPLHQLGTRAY